MRKIPRRPKYRNTDAQPDLFAWSPVQVIISPSNRAAARIAARLGISVDHATTVVRLADIGSEFTR
jgi:hypothetical protein